MCYSREKCGRAMCSDGTGDILFRRQKLADILFHYMHFPLFSPIATELLSTEREKRSERMQSVDREVPGVCGCASRLSPEKITFDRRASGSFSILVREKKRERRGSEVI